jgi:alginate O-acetyltransferase complex protein AlgI
MVFNSLTFLVFLGITLFFYYRLGHQGQNWLLLIASYIFYGWWDYRFAGLLLLTSFLDYGFALWIDRNSNQSRKRFFLTLSIVINMGVLCVFKYFNFFADSLKTVLESLGVHASFPILHVILPVGISFYTFLSMSYTIDVYRGEIRASRNPVDFLLYVSFFPHLVAGPIVRASYLMPQCQSRRAIHSDQVVNGIWLILMGYLKKVVIADQLAGVVNWGFSQPAPPFADCRSWLIVYAFAFQIYGDFAGYSDIARGLAKLMGFELVKNFGAPYLVTGPSQFWKHWHISLSTWLRDYVYIPLGGNRRGSKRTYANLMTTMLLGGLWHGAGLAYVLWGFFHGALLSIQRWWSGASQAKGLEETVSSRSPLGSRVSHLFRVLIFFHITCLGWLLFRAGVVSDFSQAQVLSNFLKAMFSFQWHGTSGVAAVVFLLGGLALFFQWKHEEMDYFSSWTPKLKAIAVCVTLAGIAAFGVFEGSQFIYFQF